MRIILRANLFAMILPYDVYVTFSSFIGWFSPKWRFTTLRRTQSILKYTLLCSLMKIHRKYISRFLIGR